MRLAGRVLACGLAIAAGGGAGVVGSFDHAVTQAGLPVGLGISLVLSVSVIAACGLATRGRLAPGLAAAAWLGTVIVLASPRPEGDLVVPATVLGFGLLLGGAVLAGLAVGWPYARHPGDQPVRASRPVGAASSAGPSADR
ncbi:MAG: hypothetical protein QOJ90_1489 [Actinomycetota bacterium]|nr:hypothetical protein [Actinomycetota bacterium]